MISEWGVPPPHFQGKHRLKKVYFFHDNLPPQQQQHEIRSLLDLLATAAGKKKI